METGPNSVHAVSSISRLVVGIGHSLSKIRIGISFHIVLHVYSWEVNHAIQMLNDAGEHMPGNPRRLLVLAVLTAF